MRKFKKALAFALASAMIVSAAPVSAATTNSAKGTKSTIYTYTVDKSKKGNANNKRSWIKVTTKKGYTYKLVNKTKDIVSLTKTRVEAKKTGTAKINVNFYKNGKYVETKSVKITVKKAPMIGKVTLDKNEITVGETTKVSNAGKGTAYFYSSNKDVATVDKTTGEITAKAAGTTTISAVNTITKARVYLTLTVNAQFAAKQSGAKEITVTGSGFTKDSKIAITRGAQTVTFDAKNVTISADGKTMTVVTNSNMIDGDYKVVVDGKEATFKGEASKITKVTSGDNAIADKTTSLPATTSGTAIVNYKVENQFGEDITKTTNVTVSSSRLKSVNQVKGEIELNVVANDREGDLVPVVIICENTNISLSKNVKLSAKSAINEITVKGLYNKEGKTYSENTAKTDDFYLLVDMKDQYGTQITSANFTDDLLLTVGGGLTGLDKVITKDSKTEKITVDGVDYFGIKLDRSAEGKKVSAGTATVLLVSKATGKSGQANITVADGVKVAKFSASPTGLVLAGAENVFEFTAVDTYGNAVENPTADLFGEDGVPAGFTFRKNAKTGKTELIYDATGKKSGLQVVTFITATREVATVQFNIQDQAKPTTIVGIKDISTGVVSGEAISFTTKNIKFEDQYGQEYTGKVDASKITYTTTGNYFDGQDGNYTAVESGDQKLTITYKDGDVTSEYTVTLSSRSLDDLKTFKAEAENKVYLEKVSNSVDVAKTLKVTGTSSDGTAITLPKTAYTATVDGIDANSVSGSALGFTSDNKKETKDANVVVVIKDRAGSSASAKVQVSNETPVATKVELSDTTTTIKKETAFGIQDAFTAITVKDQYGTEMTKENSNVRVKFSGFKDTDVVTNNNTSAASITVKSDVSYITVEYTFGNGLTYTANLVVTTK